MFTEHRYSAQIDYESVTPFVFTPLAYRKGYRVSVKFHVASKLSVLVAATLLSVPTAEIFRS